MSVGSSGAAHDSVFDRLYWELVEAWMHNEFVTTQDLRPDATENAKARLCRARLAVRQWHDERGK